MSRANMVSSSGFCYAADTSANNPAIHIQTHLANQVAVGYDSNPDLIFNLSTGMEMVGFPKHHQGDSQDHHNNTASTSNSMLWKGFFGKSSTSPSSSKAATTINEITNEYYHHHQQQQQHQYDKPEFTTSGNMMVADDPSLRCVFPCEGNERPSQGLSLSLSSSNPSSIGLQSFELRDANSNPSQPQEQHHDDDHTKEGFFFGRTVGIQQHMVQDGSFIPKGVSSNFHHHQQGQIQFRNSKYLGPARELLNEFCSLGSFQNDPSPKQKNQKSKISWEDDNNGNTSSGSSKQQSVYSLDFVELQKRKSKLLSMLDELDRRYRHYCDQMKAVVSSFEAVAGDGAAKVYSALASKAMSRHFRCLRDGIVAQIHVTKKAMGEKDAVTQGTSRGETPRLRIIDQALRQQKAFQQMSMMENHPWRPQRGLPERSVSILRAWLFEHFLHPYPSDVDKHILARQTGLSRSQVSNWFINARVRLWKPMVEEMYIEEIKEQDQLGSSDGMTDPDEIGQSDRTLPVHIEDQKPTPDQLVRIDSECLSSIITSPDSKIDPKSNRNPQNHQLQHHNQQTNFGYNVMELDFSSYGHHAAVSGAVSYANDPSNNQNFTRGGGVSLTLGLQQHEGNSGGVSLAFSPTSQSSLFYHRDPIEDCQTVQYSLLDGEAQNLPYRNLTGAQLLHDLAG